MQERVEFTQEMKESYTILIPNMLPVHLKLVQDVFMLHGYKMVLLDNEGPGVVEAGLKYVHNDTCYPALLVIGQFIDALQSGKYDLDRTALIITQTGGGCRASNYIHLLRKALQKAGMSQVPVISLNPAGLEKNSGFQITPTMVLQGVFMVLYADVLMCLKNQVEPYENEKGACERLMDHWAEKLTDQFRQKPRAAVLNFKRNLRDIARDFDQVPYTPQNKIKVGIVGEIYVKYSPFGNNGLEKYLLSQDCEYMIPGVLGFFQYCFANNETDRKYYGRGGMPVAFGKIAESISEGWEKWISDAIADYPEFIPPVEFADIKRLASNVIDRGVKMGEGWLLPGEAAGLIERGYSNIICAQPFGCLPNHIVGKGTIRRLRELYPDANIFPIDYDAGASRVNQENRIKLMLAIARGGGSET